MIERDRLAEGEVVSRRVARAPWSPAQFVALAIGIFFIVLGGVALARTGIHTDNMTRMTQVGGWQHTTWLGLGELAYGLLMLAAGAVPGGLRGLMSFLGVAALGFGIIVVIQPSSFHRTLGVTAGNGWLYVVTGAVSVLAAMAAPVVFGSDRVAERRHREVYTH
ncbi:MAG: hypothetical protein JWO37_2649 [Acidimicrobiales bacterium]|jgi:hypothetical protein|nr:hypothetical protein [Acidimicrobiales bacterium]